MLYTIIAFFALTAVLGMILLSFVLQGKETPKAVVFTHGPLAVIGLVLLIIYALDQSPGPMESIILFVIAALGGLVMVWKDLTRQVVPKWLAVFHGLLAVTGFVFLLIHAFQK
jgi:hypothetical protein